MIWLRGLGETSAAERARRRRRSGYCHSVFAVISRTHESISVTEPADLWRAAAYPARPRRSFPESPTWTAL